MVKLYPVDETSGRVFRKSNRKRNFGHMMAWIDKYKNYWRIAVLVLLLAAFLGPWGYDLIVVPEEYAEDACSHPNVWLEGDYCGVPFLGTAMIAQWASGVITLLTGGIDLTYGILPLISFLFVCLILLPFIASLLPIQVRGSRTRQVSRIVVWSLAAGASTLLLITHALRMGNFSWIVLLRSKLWGSWLYIGLAALAIILEILAWKGDESLAREREL
jgi:hypothetical protein